MIASSATLSSTSLSTIPFTFGFSTTASITRSASLSVLYSRVGVIALSVCAILAASTLPRCMPLPRIFAASERPRSSAPWLISFMITGVPFTALWYAIPPPMMPAPSTALSLDCLVAAFACFLPLLLTSWSARKIPICAFAASVFANATKPSFSSLSAPSRSRPAAF